jgi:hypothetical protein
VRFSFPVSGRPLTKPQLLDLGPMKWRPFQLRVCTFYSSLALLCNGSAAVLKSESDDRGNRLGGRADRGGAFGDLHLLLVSSELY